MFVGYVTASCNFQYLILGWPTLAHKFATHYICAMRQCMKQDHLTSIDAISHSFFYI